MGRKLHSNDNFITAGRYLTPEDIKRAEENASLFCYEFAVTYLKATTGLPHYVCDEWARFLHRKRGKEHDFLQ